MRDSDLDDLAAELAEFAPSEKKGGRSASDERIIAGFEEIQRFVERGGRVPQHGEDRDIFERLYAVRLDRLRALPECWVMLEPMDHQDLLKGTSFNPEALELDDLAKELAGATELNDITVLRHVRTFAEKRTAEDIADRKSCEGFETFQPLFERVHAEVTSGLRQSQSIVASNRGIDAGDFFVLAGLVICIATDLLALAYPQIARCVEA